VNCPVVTPTGRPLCAAVLLLLAAGTRGSREVGARCGDHIAQACATPAGAEHHALLFGELHQVPPSVAQAGEPPLLVAPSSSFTGLPLLRGCSALLS
jgi:hypothetical protein